MFTKFFGFILRHKFYSLLVLAMVAGGGYYGYQKYFNSAAAARYITTKVTRGALITSISGTGQVSAYNQVDVAAKTSGDVTGVNVKTGQAVKAGALLASIDAADALKTYRDAKTSLETAELTLQKTKEPPTELQITQAENSLYQANASLQKNKDALNKAYEDGYNDVSDTFLDLGTVITGIYDLLYGSDFNNIQNNIDWYANSGASLINIGGYDNDKSLAYREQVRSSYDQARAAYDANLEAYKFSSRLSSTSTIEALIADTYETVKLISDVIKNSYNYIDYINDHIDGYYVKLTASEQTLVNSQKNTLNTYTGTVNANLSTLLAAKQTLIDDKTSIITTAQSIKEKTLSLADLKAGADALDIRAQEISIQKAKDTLAEASSALADYSLRAPFDGILASVDINKGDSVSSGKVAATIITAQKIATITLNEVDAAKVKAGQKATLTFDAVEDLSITGAVAEVDTLGTVSSGVVS